MTNVTPAERVGADRGARRLRMSIVNDRSTFLPDRMGTAASLCRVLTRRIGDGQPLLRAEAERWIDVTASNDLRRGYGKFARWKRMDDRSVGFRGRVHPGGQDLPEVKCALLRSFWGRGLATEAIKALLSYDAAARGLTSIIATAAPANPSSPAHAHQGRHGQSRLAAR